MKITSESTPIYGEDVKYIKTKIKTYAGNIIIITIRKCPKKNHHVNVYQ